MTEQNDTTTDTDTKPPVKKKAVALDFRALAADVLTEAHVPTAEEERRAGRGKLGSTSKVAEVYAVIDMIARDEVDNGTAEQEIASIAAVVKPSGLTKPTLKARYREARDAIHREKMAAAQAASAAAKKAEREGKEAGRKSNDFRELLTRFDKKHAVVAIGNSVKVITFPDEGQDGTPKFLSDKGFELLYSTVYATVTKVDENGVERTSKFPIAEYWLRSHEDRPSYEDVEFLPYGINETPGKNDLPLTTLNLWRGWRTKPVKGDWSLLRTHIFENICHSNPQWFAWFMSWAADIVQDPRNKKGTAVIVKGLKRTGKTKFADWFRALMPHNSNSITKSEQLIGRFNKHQSGSLFTVLEEALWSGDKKAEGTVKSMITDNAQFIEGKHVDGVMLASFTRYFYISNEKWVVPTTADDARFFVLEILPNRKEDFKFFEAVDEQMKNGGLEAMFYDLANLKRPDWVQLRKPPDTPWLNQQVKESHNILEQWWEEVRRVRALEIPYKSRDSGPDDTLLVPLTPRGDVNPKTAAKAGSIEVDRKEVIQAAQLYAKKHGTRYIPNPAKIDEFLKDLGATIPRTKALDGVREYVVRIDAEDLSAVMGQDEFDPPLTQADPNGKKADEGVTRADPDAIDPRYVPWIAYGKGGELPD